jgi:outer membrane immunogenic protein
MESIMRKVSVIAIALALFVVAPASAADLGAPRTPIAAVAVAPAGFNWTGFYVGGHLGIASIGGRVDAFTPRNNFAGFDLQQLGGTALMGGMQIGYNHQINNLVLGLEADLSAVGFSKQTTTSILEGNIPLFSRSLSWTSTITPRLGVTFGRALLFAKGGLALGAFRVGHDQNGNLLSASTTRLGWTVGAGLEYAVTQNLTAKVEYNYMNFGNFRSDMANIWLTQKADVHAVKIGVNYLFSTGPSAVVARY